MTTFTKQLARTRRARKNLGFKMILERRFNPEINSYFAKILKDFKDVYSTSGVMLDMNNYTTDTQTLLKKQYTRVQRFFKKEMREEDGKSINIPMELKQDEREQELDALINTSLLMLADQSSRERSEFIIDTNSKQMQESIDEANEQIAQENLARTQEGQDAITITDALIASQAVRILKRKYDARKQLINTTETQFMSEKTKAVEANVMSGREPMQGVVSPVELGEVREATKMWAAILDKRTRDIHASADGQTRNIDEPYLVNGERLMHPGDPSLGASAKNLINCRCSSLNNIK